MRKSARPRVDAACRRTSAAARTHTRTHKQTRGPYLAMGLVLVSRPFSCSRKCRVTVPCAASASTVRPSGVTSTDVIMPSDPKPARHAQPCPRERAAGGGRRTLRHRVGLHVAVVVLGGPDEAAVALERLRHHVVDQAVLVRDVRRRKAPAVVAAPRVRPAGAAEAEGVRRQHDTGQRSPGRCP
jgi:hypothetical protein